MTQEADESININVTLTGGKNYDNSADVICERSTSQLRTRLLHPLGEKTETAAAWRESTKQAGPLVKGPLYRMIQQDFERNLS